MEKEYALIYLIPVNAPIRITKPIIRGITGFCTNPAITYVTQEITATTITYGSCVDT